MIRDIVVNLSSDVTRDATADYAISAADTLKAHLLGVAFAYEAAILGSPFDGPGASIVDTWQDENKRAAQQAKVRFDEAARRAGISGESRVIVSGIVASGSSFGEIARSYDLSIVAQATPGNGLAETEIIHAALFQSGRPVLVVPYIQKSAFKIDHVIVCWDGSSNAARAVADALPLLEKAEKIDVVTFEKQERRNELVGVEIAEHLARYGLHVELKSIVSLDVDVPNAILSYAADSSADLIVMGGYGHSRIREFILGGTTDSMLRTMTVPTLLSH